MRSARGETTGGAGRREGCRGGEASPPAPRLAKELPVLLERVSLEAERAGLDPLHVSALVLLEAAVRSARASAEALAKAEKRYLEAIERQVARRREHAASVERRDDPEDRYRRQMASAAARRLVIVAGVKLAAAHKADEEGWAMLVDIVHEWSPALARPLYVDGMAPADRTTEDGDVWTAEECAFWRETFHVEPPKLPPEAPPLAAFVPRAEKQKPLKAGPFEVWPLNPGRWQVIDQRRAVADKQVEGPFAYLSEANTTLRAIAHREGLSVETD